MTDRIEAILFDMGGTLRSSLQTDPVVKEVNVRRIMELIDSRLPLRDFTELLAGRARSYTRWARETLVELKESELWIKWMLPDYPAGQVGEIAIQLNQLWRDATGRREIFPETKDVVLELFRRGYRLGIVSNTVSSVEVPRALRQLEISGCFETVILSCQVGIRKPNSAILLEAIRRMGIESSACAYIGDRHDRDVIASKGAGFSTAVILRSFDALMDQDRDDIGPEADYYIGNLKELLDIFPARNVKSAKGPTYNTSLSTMWARKNFPRLSDFFEATRRLGFTFVELNHQVDSAMMDGLENDDHTISSIHEPCPADISTEELKDRNWLISSPDEACRRSGLEAIRRSIDLGVKLGVPVIVVHSGIILPDPGLEKKLRALFEAGGSRTEEYREIQQEMIETRARLIGPRFESVKKSLRELLEYAGHFHIRLGLENRYHYFDIPIPDEMEELLALSDSSRLGFVYDVGHAQTLDRLGFFPHEEWLQRFSSRMIETHLHDVTGVNDHLAPGLGEVDFDMVASYLPEEAIRTLELQATNSPEQIKACLEFLYRHGCIRSH